MQSLLNEKVQYVSDAAGNTVSVLIPIELWRELAPVASHRNAPPPLPPGVSGASLLHLAGILPDEDAKEMLAAIEDCGKVEATLSPLPVP